VLQLYSDADFARGIMIRRILCILALAVIRLAAAVDRTAGQEPGPPKPNMLPMPTLGGKQFWADELFCYQWRIQRNAVTGHYRLLDPQDRRQAWGTFEKCRAVLENIKRKQRLPRMTGKAVILLHGLGGSRAAMAALAQDLEDQGGYRVFNVSYPSMQEDMADHARSLNRVIDNLEDVEEIYFVGYSMGNLVIRHYLGDLARREPWKQSADAIAADRRAIGRFRRFVMLAPPNRGAELAELFADNLLFREIAGETGQQLGRDWSDLEKRLATPAFEFGILAGGKGDGRGYNPLLSGDNDGTISVETTMLPGARDFLVVPAVHPFFPENPKVREYTLRFLQKGYFTSEKERHPLEAKIENQTN